LIVLLAGWGMIVSVARTQSQAVERSPWAKTLVFVGSEPALSPRYPGVVRRLQEDDVPYRSPALEQFTAELNKTPDGREFIAATGLDRNEYVHLLELPADQWPTLLESGRLPTPGAREVLRESLARFERFTLDGEDFTVVGRLRRDLPGMGFGYVLPEHPEMRARHFSGQDVERTWLVPSGLAEVAAGRLDLRAADAPQVISPLAQAPPGHAETTILGLALMAVGGSGLQMLLLAWLSRRRVPIVGAALQELGARPVLLATFHVAYYGLFFLMMWLMIYTPLTNLRIGGLLDQSFESGLLGFVRQSYLAENVPLAAFATWLWNYGVATLALVFLPTLVPVLGMLFGLFKTALSFAAVGCGISPLWLGIPKTLTYHSGTMVLELEAYIVTAFVIVVSTGYFVMGVSTLGWPEGKRRVLRGAKIFVGGALLVGIMLAIAALYEAATIIAFGGMRT
jgi:hypothetical protein